MHGRNLSTCGDCGKTFNDFVNDGCPFCATVEDTTRAKESAEDDE